MAGAREHAVQLAQISRAEAIVVGHQNVDTIAGAAQYQRGTSEERKESHCAGARGG